MSVARLAKLTSEPGVAAAELASPASAASFSAWNEGIRKKRALLDLLDAMAGSSCTVMLYSHFRDVR